MSSVALLDANVLYPSLTRNLLMHCATSGVIAARWTSTIHDEWIKNLLSHQPDLDEQKLQRTRQMMERAVPDAEVTGYEVRIPELMLILPDQNDAHVLAAAIHAKAQFLVTSNLKDFPSDVLEQYDILALNPDDFMCYLMESQPIKTLTAIEQLRVSFRNPPLDKEQLYQRLSQVGFSKLIYELNG